MSDGVRDGYDLSSPTYDSVDSMISERPEQQHQQQQRSSSTTTASTNSAAFWDEESLQDREDSTRDSVVLEKTALSSKSYSSYYYVMSKLRNRFVPSAKSGSGTSSSTTTTTTTTIVLEQQQQQQAQQEEQKSNGSSYQKATFFSSCLSNKSSTSTAATASAASSSSSLPQKEEQQQQRAVLLLGFDISKFPRRTQFCVCTAGVFFFYLIYGYLQELMQVHVCNRQYGLFLTAAQFAGYTAWSFLFRQYNHYYCCRGDYEMNKKSTTSSRSTTQSSKTTTTTTTTTSVTNNNNNTTMTTTNAIGGITKQAASVPILLYIGLSVLRAVDLSMTNMSMQYVNFPAKTLMKSSRVVFTMFFGILLTNKRYKMQEYVLVICMIAGLALFLHADSKASAVFEPIGIVMLVGSLICDGLLSNVAERIMHQYGVGQDEYIYRMHSIALVAICGAAAWTGDLMNGIQFMMQPGTYHETTTTSSAVATMRLLLLKEDDDDDASGSIADLGTAEATMNPSWSVGQKWLVLVGCFTMGFLGNSCSGAITKNFGALAMTITSTARMATTLFLSFMLFAENTCTLEHLAGIAVFCVTTRQLWLGV